jgi:hypothetical protein
MFNGAQGWSDRATIFADGKLLGNPHWIEWRTKADVTVKSAAVFAKQNVTGSAVRSANLRCSLRSRTTGLKKRSTVRRYRMEAIALPTSAKPASSRARSWQSA